MRIGFVVAVLMLLGAQTGPASAGLLPMRMLLPCAPSASTALPRHFCRDLAAVLLGPASGLSLAVIDPLGTRAWSLGAAKLPVGSLLPSIPVQQEGWRHHMETVVARYDAAFGADGTVVMPSAPAVVWPGGSPFAARAAD